jgi:hypothetical protein
MFFEAGVREEATIRLPPGDYFAIIRVRDQQGRLSSHSNELQFTVPETRGSQIMAFDRNDPADLTSLNSELVNDPIAQGYNFSDTKRTLELLNDSALNNGGESVGRTFSVEAALDALDVSDLSSNQTNPAAATFLNTLAVLDSGVNSRVDVSQYAAKFRALFAAL